VICRRNHYGKYRGKPFTIKYFISHSLVFNDCLSIIYMQRCGSGSRYGYGTYCLNLEIEENFILCDKFFFMALVSKTTGLNSCKVILYKGSDPEFIAKSDPNPD
jgi:hypothetical protein